MKEPMFDIYNVRNLKVLLDGERAEGFANDKFFAVNGDGIQLKFIAMSPVLKQLMRHTPERIKALYVDDNCTITIQMEIKDCMIEPIAFEEGNVPTVSVQLFGKSLVNFED